MFSFPGGVMVLPPDRSGASGGEGRSFRGGIGGKKKKFLYICKR